MLVSSSSVETAQNEAESFQIYILETMRIFLLIANAFKIRYALPSLKKLKNENV